MVKGIRNGIKWLHTSEWVAGMDEGSRVERRIKTGISVYNGRVFEILATRNPDTHYIYDCGHWTWPSEEMIDEIGI